MYAREPHSVRRHLNYYTEQTGEIYKFEKLDQAQRSGQNSRTFQF